MSDQRFQPAFLDDGSLDPASLERAGLRAVSGWLTARLSGTDLLLPLDTRADEDPEALVIDILRDAGPAHAASDLIGRSVLAILDGGRKVPAEAGQAFERVLVLCQQIRVPHTGCWFIEELQRFAADADAAEMSWQGTGRAEAIVAAAGVQASGLPGSAAFESWKRLLTIPRYTTLALLALGPSFELQASYLQDWWASCPREESPRELRQLVFQAAQELGVGELLRLLKESEGSWSSDLRAQVERALAEEGLPALQREAEVAYRAGLSAASGRPEKPYEEEQDLVSLIGRARYHWTAVLVGTSPRN